MSAFTMAEAARLLGVSDDTLRRWADQGRVETVTAGGRRRVEGAELARFAVSLAEPPERDRSAGRSTPMIAGSARNRFSGLVTRVVRDAVMAQVDLQAGPFRVVSLMSREAADELGLEAGVLAVAVVKSTSVVIEIPERG